MNYYPQEPKIRWNTADFNSLLLWAVHSKISDVSLSSGNPIWVRIHGYWEQVTKRPISTDELVYALEAFTANNSIGVALQSGRQDYDFSYFVEEKRGLRHRFRGNASPIAHGHGTGVRIVFRAIASEPAYLTDLNLEQAIIEHAFPQNGLVLITGVMGSGKTTTLSALMREIIEKGGRHIITYESPIETDFSTIKNPKGPITQSNIPFHFENFASAVRNSTRSAPDVVLIGESRDPETLRGMIESAEIGVTAYSTVHTRSVAETISRILNVFMFEEQKQLSATLLASLRLIVSQRLLPSPLGGRVAIREFLPFTPKIRQMLLSVPMEQLIEKVEILVSEFGQSITKSAILAFEEKRIFEADYKAILAETLNKE